MLTFTPLYVLNIQSRRKLFITAEHTLSTHCSVVSVLCVGIKVVVYQCCCCYIFLSCLCVGLYAGHPYIHLKSFTTCTCLFVHFQNIPFLIMRSRIYELCKFQYL